MPLANPPTLTKLILLFLSATLTLPLLTISSHILGVYKSQHGTNPWWLPIWHAHFDTSGLTGVISTSCIIFFLDIFCIGLVIWSSRQGQKRGFITWILLVAMLVAAIAALVALVMPAAANAAAPTKSDTVQTWTCKWKDAAGAPENFGSLCRESLFSSFAPIPLFVIHVLLVAQSVKDILTLLKTQGKQDGFDEEMVRITKSVEVATLGSQNSPRLQGEKDGEREGERERV